MKMPTSNSHLPLSVPESRVQVLRDDPIAEGGDFVLYWMTAFRRLNWNFAFQRAVQLAADLQKPIVVLEALRCDYKWASDRLHYFVIQGMADNLAASQKRRSTYYPYLEESPGEGSGLLAALASRASAVVTDDFPSFFLPRMVRLAARKVDTRMEMVDSNGLLPMRAADKVFARAHDFRRFLHKRLPEHLMDFPLADPLEVCELPTLSSLPKQITDRWPAADVESIAKQPERLTEFPIDHDVSVVPHTPGGYRAGQRLLSGFIDERLPIYGEERNQPQVAATSGFSPYLHFGHLSAHQVFSHLADRLDWNPSKLAPKPTGSRSGWWGMDESSESFLDELITWRELGFNMCWQREDYARYSSLPEWAKKTMQEHTSDQREYVYSLDEFEQAQTHDDLWNAAQNQLVREGIIHNYLRMLWGKKILEWSPTPEDALAVMIELNNKYALDGRNPNSYSGIFWVLGRYDRAWGPERSIFGKIRYMSSENTARKVKVKDFVERYK